MNQAKQLLQDLNLPDGDRYDLPTSPILFGDGGHYRIEIPSVEGPGAMAAVLDEAQRRGVRVHRVSQGSGMMLLTDGELREMAALGAQHQVEVSLFVGPRATWEGTGQPLTPDGKLLGWRHTGMDQLAYAFEDIVRGVEAGIRSILVADDTNFIKEKRRRFRAKMRRESLKKRVLRRLRNVPAATVEGAIAKLRIAAEAIEPDDYPSAHRVLLSAVADLRALQSRG